jgi:hypothetical protein
MMDVWLDMGEVRGLEYNLAGAPARVQRGASAAVRRGAMFIEEGMREDFSGHVGSYFSPRTRHKRATPIDRYASHRMRGPLSADIGIELGGAGSLAPILADGTANSNPVVDGAAAMRRARPWIAHWMGTAGEDAVLGRDQLR